MSHYLQNPVSLKIGKMWLPFKKALINFHPDIHVHSVWNSSESPIRGLWGYNEKRTIFWRVCEHEIDRFDIYQLHKEYTQLTQGLQGDKQLYLFVPLEGASQQVASSVSRQVESLFVKDVHVRLLGYRGIEENAEKGIMIQEFFMVAQSEPDPAFASDSDSAKGLVSEYHFFEHSKLSREELRDFIDFELDLKMQGS